MAASILDAIQDVATPTMINSAKSLLGLSEATATSALGAASTSILGGLIEKSSDAALMGKVAALVAGLKGDGGMFANLPGFLMGGLPSSPAQIAGNKLLGLVYGATTHRMMASVASAAGVDAKAASGLTTLAAPMVLAALHSKLGTDATPSSLIQLLAADKSIIASAMPASLRTLYGLAAAGSAAAAVVPEPVAQSASGHAATKAAQSSAPLSPAPAPAAMRPVIPASVAATVAPAGQASPSTAAAAPAKMASPAPAAPKADAPSKEPVMPAADGETDRKAGLLPIVALLIPLVILGALIWYWAYIKH